MQDDIRGAAARAHARNNPSAQVFQCDMPSMRIYNIWYSKYIYIYI